MEWVQANDGSIVCLGLFDHFANIVVLWDMREQKGFQHNGWKQADTRTLKASLCCHDGLVSGVIVRADFDLERLRHLQ